MSLTIGKGVSLRNGVTLNVGGTPLRAIFGNGSGMPWVQTEQGPSAVHNAATRQTLVTWEAGIYRTNTRLIMGVLRDDVTGVWSQEYLIGTRTLTDDDHGTPAAALCSGAWYVFYGAHSSTIKVAGSTDGVVWADTEAVAGSHTFFIPVVIGSNLVLISNSASPGNPSDVQGAIVARTYAPSAGVLGSASSTSTLFDGYSGSGSNWLPISWAVAVGTDIHMIFDYASGVGVFPLTALYYAILDTTTGAVRNYDGTHSVASGSLPINYTDLNSFFKIYTFTSAGSFPILLINGTQSHIVMAEGTTTGGNAILKYITASGGGAFAAPVTLFTFPTNVAASNVYPEAIVNGAGGIDVFFGDGVAAASYTPAGSPGGGASGNIQKMVRSSGGTWSGPTQVLAPKTGWSLDNPTAVFGGVNSLKVLATELTFNNVTLANPGTRAYGLDSSGGAVVGRIP